MNDKLQIQIVEVVRKSDKKIINTFHESQHIELIQELLTLSHKAQDFFIRYRTIEYDVEQ